MTEIIQKVKNLSIGFKSKKGEEILILRNISTNIKKVKLLVLLENLDLEKALLHLQ